VIGGGVIPDADITKLKQMGVAEIVLQDTPPDAIVETVQRLAARRRA
jgi:methylmalonyl-CoA mutase C-terminal domain/subunit